MQQHNVQRLHTAALVRSRKSRGNVVIHAPEPHTLSRPRRGRQEVARTQGVLPTAAVGISVERFQWRESTRENAMRGREWLPPWKSSRNEGDKVSRLCARALSPRRQHERQQALQLMLPQLADGPKAQEPRRRGRVVCVGRAMRRGAVHLRHKLRNNERLLIVAGSSLLMSVSHTALRPVLPFFAKSFGVGAAAVGTTLTAYAAARLCTNIPSGILADRHGRKPLLICGPAITALGMVGCGLAATFPQLLAARCVTGVGSALQNTGAQLFLADISTTENRAQCLGTNQAAALIGSFFGPAMGGALGELFGLRAPFIVTGCAGIAALYGAIRLPETHVMAAAVCAPQVAALTTHSPGKLEPTDIPPSVAAWEAELEKQEACLVNGTAGPSTYSTSTVPEIHRPAWQRLLSSPNFRAISLVNAVLFTTNNGARAVLMPLLAEEKLGMKTSLLGFIFAGMALVAFLGVLPASRLSDRLGRKWAIVPSAIATASALLLMAHAGCVEAFIGAAALHAMGTAIIGQSPAAYAADVMPSDAAGLGLGIYRCAGDLGLMFGPALLGLLADATSVGIALTTNAAALAAIIAWFACCARSSKRLRAQGSA